jgi:DNA-binding MarR family transcriptional regulator
VATDQDPIPSDLTAFDDADFETDVRPLLGALAESPMPRPARRVRALLLDRAINLLRGGSRDEIDDEGFALAGFLASPAGKRLRADAPDVFGGFSAISRLLNAAADRADEGAVESILRNNNGAGLGVLRFLDKHEGPIPELSIGQQLGIPQSHLFKALRELSEADLITRFKQGEAIMVDISDAGRRAAA